MLIEQVESFDVDAIKAGAEGMCMPSVHVAAPVDFIAASPVLQAFCKEIGSETGRPNPLTSVHTACMIRAELRKEQGYGRGGHMRMAKGFGKGDWKAEAERVLAAVTEDPWWIGKEIDSTADLRWRLGWTTVAYTDTLKIQHRTATWSDSTFGTKSIWRAVER